MTVKISIVYILFMPWPCASSFYGIKLQYVKYVDETTSSELVASGDHKRHMIQHI